MESDRMILQEQVERGQQDRQAMGDQLAMLQQALAHHKKQTEYYRHEWTTLKHTNTLLQTNMASLQEELQIVQNQAEAKNKAYQRRQDDDQQTIARLQKNQEVATDHRTLSQKIRAELAQEYKSALDSKAEQINQNEIQIFGYKNQLQKKESQLEIQRLDWEYRLQQQQEKHQMELIDIEHKIREQHDHEQHYEYRQQIELQNAETQELRKNNQLLEDQLYQLNKQYDYYKEQKNNELQDLIRKTSGHQLEKLRHEDIQMENVKKIDYLNQEIDILRDKLKAHHIQQEEPLHQSVLVDHNPSIQIQQNTCQSLLKNSNMQPQVGISQGGNGSMKGQMVNGSMQGQMVNGSMQGQMMNGSMQGQIHNGSMQGQIQNGSMVVQVQQYEQHRKQVEEYQQEIDRLRRDNIRLDDEGIEKQSKIDSMERQLEKWALAEKKNDINRQQVEQAQKETERYRNKVNKIANKLKQANLKVMQLLANKFDKKNYQLDTYDEPYPSVGYQAEEYYPTTGTYPVEQPQYNVHQTQHIQYTHPQPPLQYEQPTYNQQHIQYDQPAYTPPPHQPTQYAPPHQPTQYPPPHQPTQYPPPQPTQYGSDSQEGSLRARAERVMASLQ